MHCPSIVTETADNRRINTIALAQDLATVESERVRRRLASMTPVMVERGLLGSQTLRYKNGESWEYAYLPWKSQIEIRVKR